MNDAGCDLPISPLTEAMNRLRGTIERTETILDVMNTRLTPVMQEIRPTPQPEKGEVLRTEDLSPLALELHALSDRLEQEIREYDRILDRLQV